MLTLLLGYGGWAYHNDPYRVGRRQALEDVANNRLRILTGGYLDARFFDYADAFQEKYGIALVHEHGCIVTTDMIERQRAYNDIMHAEIEKRFGGGSYEKMSKGAHTLAEERRDAAAKKRLADQRVRN